MNTENSSILKERETDPRAFSHENSVTDSRYSEAQDMRRIIGSMVNAEVMDRNCLDCGAPFQIPAGTVFHSSYQRCVGCAEINDAKVEAARKAEEKAKQIEVRKNWCAEIVPKLYQTFDLNRVPVKSQANHKRFVAWQPGPKGLIAVGAPGSGKTFALYQLLQRLVMEGNKVHVFDCASFGHKCHSAFLNGRGEAWALEIATVPILAFDDLFKMSMPERTESELFAVVERRCANMLPILATMNSTGAMIEERMSGDRGKPMIRRLREFNEVVTFNL